MYIRKVPKGITSKKTKEMLFIITVRNLEFNTWQLDIKGSHLVSYQEGLKCTQDLIIKGSKL